MTRGVGGKALYHNTKPRQGAGTGRWACGTGRRDGAGRRHVDASRAGAQASGRHGSRHSTQGRARESCDTAAWAAIRPGASATTRPGLPTIRPGVRVPGRACARLGVLLGHQAMHLVHTAYF